MRTVSNVAFAASLLASACSVRDPLFCDPTHPCSSGQYCDTTGEYDPQHIRNSCVANPFDAAPVGSLAVNVADGSFYVRRAGTVSVDVTLTRGPGVQGDVAISVESPPQGVTFDALTIAAGATTGTLVAHAALSALYSRTSLMVDAVAGMTTVSDTLDLSVIGNPGDIDTTFGGGGQVVLGGTGLAGVFAQGTSIVVVLTATHTGHQGVLATRLLPTGGVDSTFGDSGSSFVDLTTIGLTGSVQSVAATQSTGKVVVSGSGSNGTNEDPFVLRLTTDGQVDPALQAQRVDTSASDDAINAIAIDSQDQIFIGGTTGPSGNRDALVMRLTSAGQLDPTFGAGRLDCGSSGNDVLSSLIVQTDGGIVAEWGACSLSCGAGVTRYKSNGTKDSTFGVGGDAAIKNYDGLRSVIVGLVTPTSFLVWGASGDMTNPSFAMWRFLSNGTPDSGFAASGVYEASSTQRSAALTSVATLPDGSILGLGYDVSPPPGSSDLYLAGVQMTAAGVPDPSVGTGGMFRDPSIPFEPLYTAVRQDHRFAVLGVVNPVTNGEIAVRTYFW